MSIGCSVGRHKDSVAREFEVRDALIQSLERTQQFLLQRQLPDGTWSGHVESDARPTAFFLRTALALGCLSSEEIGDLERYLNSEQLDCGAWEAWPGGGPDIDVTTACVLALDAASTQGGREARDRGREWLCDRAAPEADSFWRGFLALNGDLDWSELPYLTPRLFSHPRWVHPNIYDFSFLRIAIAAASILQMRDRSRGSVISRTPEQNTAFDQWKRRWIVEARKPLPGIASMLCNLARAVDEMLPVTQHRNTAINWLLAHQEVDGSFFSSVHMTSIAVLALHNLDAQRYRTQIQAGIDAMRDWQKIDQRGRRQQFTDSTTWDTILCFDLLKRLGESSSSPQMQRARSYVMASQNNHLGDWSRRARNVPPGGWAFQRTGRWYPDNDDTVTAVTALLDADAGVASDATVKGVRWLLGMQCSNGGWASWDRDDRAWIAIPNGGPWFARDLACPEITARVLILLSRILRKHYRGLDQFESAARKAVQRGIRWLKRERQTAGWYGRWFTHYLYGNCHVLEAYRELGRSPDRPDIQQTKTWLLSVANEDGGFGEAPDSGRGGAFIAAASTPFHTGCALLSLIYAGAGDHLTAHRATSWLLDHQNADGGWTNQDFFAAGVPGLWYANFEFTPTYFAAKSLRLFADHLRTR